MSTRNFKRPRQGLEGLCKPGLLPMLVINGLRRFFFDSSLVSAKSAGLGWSGRWTVKRGFPWFLDPAFCCAAGLLRVPPACPLALNRDFRTATDVRDLARAQRPEGLKCLYDSVLLVGEAHPQKGNVRIDCERVAQAFVNAQAGQFWRGLEHHATRTELPARPFL